jgi:hypothetical protein
MSPALAAFVLAIHLVVIGFNVAGLVLIPLGAGLRWAWVRIRWLRALHLASMAVVALQAALGRACFLTLWQDQLAGSPGEPPLLMRWINSLVYWPLPIWAFTAAYLALFAFVLALWRRVPPRRR